MIAVAVRLLTHCGAALAGLFVLLALPACSAPAPDTAGAQSITLTYASLYPPNHPFSRADQRWIEFVERESGGRVRIRPFWSGTIISSNQNLVELRHGMADIGMITPMYARTAHLQRVQASFYNDVDGIAPQIAAYRCLASRFPEFNAELPGLHVLAVQGGNYPGILTRGRPVRRLADLRGLRLRAQSDMAAILRAAGGDPVEMPMSEVYSSMARGVIDGVIAPADALRSMHLAEVGDYYTAFRIPRGAYPARAMSERRWRSLPEDVRALLTRSQDVWETALTEEIHGGLRAGSEFGREKGITFIAVAPEEQTRLNDFYNRDAMNSARRLAGYGIDAEPIVRAAWNIVAAQRAGQLAECGRTG